MSVSRCVLGVEHMQRVDRAVTRVCGDSASECLPTMPGNSGRRKLNCRSTIAPRRSRPTAATRRQQGCPGVLFDRSGDYLGQMSVRLDARIATTINRTCGFPASGSPTSFISYLTAAATQIARWAWDAGNPQVRFSIWCSLLCSRLPFINNIKSSILEIPCQLSRCS